MVAQLRNVYPMGWVSVEVIRVEHILVSVFPAADGKKQPWWI